VLASPAPSPLAGRQEHFELHRSRLRRQEPEPGCQEEMMGIVRILMPIDHPTLRAGSYLLNLTEVQLLYLFPMVSRYC